jgi:hypothetical protein
VLSSILVKVSRRPGDTAQRVGPRRLASGFTIRLFLEKTDELIARLARFATLLPEGGGAPRFRVGDARRLEGIEDHAVDLVVTSPPYPGNYDYLSHHEVRLRWLGLDATELARVELGARRHLEPLAEKAAVERWRSELAAALAAMARVLRPEGRAVLVLADSVVGRRAVFADDLVREVAPRVGLFVTAVGSQARPHFHAATARAFAARPRREHVLVLGWKPSAAKVR